MDAVRGRVAVRARVVMRVLRTVCLLAAVAVLSACSRPAARPDRSPEPRRGGTLVLGSISDVDVWNEYLSRQSVAVNLLHRVYLPLAVERPGKAGRPEYEPRLASSWDLSADGRRITFHLREARWSDGAPVTAEDVRFTWRAQTSPEVAWINAYDKERITDVEVVDDRTVRFHFDRAYPEALGDAVEGGIVPVHLFRGIPFSSWRTHDWSQERVGSGPFLLEEHRPEQEIVLTRNPLYFRAGFPRLDRVVVRIVPDSANLFAQWLAGSLDVVDGVAPRNGKRVEETPGCRLVTYDDPMFNYIGWNEARAPLDDPELRRALTLALDRRALVEDLLFGYGRISRGPVPSSSWAADPGIEPWPHDPGEAAAILRRLGFRPRPGDGVLERNGKPLEIELITNAGNRVREEMLVKIQHDLARVGVSVRVRPVEFNTLIARTRKGRYDAYLGGWRISGRLDLAPFFASDRVPDRGVNVVRYSSPEVDELLAEADAASDWEAKGKILREVQRILHRDQPYTFLYETRRLMAVGPRARGVRIPIPSDPLDRVEEFWVDR